MHNVHNRRSEAVFGLKKHAFQKVKHAHWVSELSSSACARNFTPSESEFRFACYRRFYVFAPSESEFRYVRICPLVRVRATSF
jgi:hypothetical protein